MRKEGGTPAVHRAGTTAEDACAALADAALFPVPHESAFTTGVVLPVDCGGTRRAGSR